MSPIYLSQNLRFLRKAFHFPQWQVALWLNVERSSYTYYETGRTLPPLLILLKLAWFFEVSLDGLVLTDLPKPRRTTSPPACNPRKRPPKWNPRRTPRQNRAGAGSAKSAQPPNSFVYSSLAAFGRLFFCPFSIPQKRLFRTPMPAPVWAFSSTSSFPSCIMHDERIEWGRENG